ncbi:MAG: sulfotransferase family 2 domain-containing protein [Paracoccaceae bacterium]
MTESESVVYRVVPKCACSTIGQIMFYSDHGEFFDGDIHDAQHGMHKWSMEASQPLINANVKTHQSYAFTCVRNPYTRVLSSFFDKICGIQRNGKRYRGNLVPLLIQKYGIEVGEPERLRIRPDQELPAVPAVRARHHRWRRPMEPDTPLERDVGPCQHLHRQWRAVRQGFSGPEKFNDGMQDVLDHIETPVKVKLKGCAALQRERGPRPKRAHPVEDYFDDLSMHLIREIYHRDFELFKYDFDDPSNKMPVGEIDLDEIHAKLGD